ncbi:MAG: APC family permease [Thermomicrobiaceae bacterium]|nr:APC family permease [Thermomicrobiaceae bacterium]
MAEPTVPATFAGRLYQRLRRLVIGQPLPTSQAVHERLTKIKALAVFSSDALSSTAYATEEILLILVLAGLAAYDYVIPIGLAIAALLAIVAFSYRQTIHAYPQGGGSYIVTKDNLGTMPSLVAAAALMTDYVLTVAVSISSGVAAITSAFSGLVPWRVELAVAAIVLVMLGNLRGIRESGTIFAVPTYMFIFGMACLLALGFSSWLGFGPAPHPVSSEIPAATHPVTLFLILRAFASGCTALTGVEAISDGVPAFKPPEADNAAKTLVAMALILGSIFLGVTFLAHHFTIVPSEHETVVSQIARTIVGRSPFYYYIQFATAGILMLAANTSFADFPRLGSFLARDKFIPHQFLFRGDRLAYSTGIIVLSVAASILVVIFKASVSALIPLYAVGVFIAFTMSQASMTVRWWRSPRSHQRTYGLAINGTGAVTTGVVALIIIVTKFLSGAWIVLLLLPLIVSQFLAIRRHYDRVATQLRMNPQEIRLRPPVWGGSMPVVVPIDTLNHAAIRAIDYAQAISRDVTVVHVAESAAEAEDLRRQWAAAGMQLPLVIIESPYRELVGPLVNFIEQLQDEKGGAPLTVVLPEFVPAHLYEVPLHNQTAWRLRTALWTHRDIVVTSVPYHLER